MKKIILLILTLAISAFMLASCKDKDNENENNQNSENGGNQNNAIVCVNHKDENGDYICDVCEEIIFEEDVEVTVEFTIKDTDGAALSGISAIFTDGDGNIVISDPSDENGKITVDLYTGRHSVTYDYDGDVLGYYLSETTSVEIKKDTKAIDLYLKDNNPDGTAEKPYSILAEDESITIEANTAYYYIVYRSVNLTFSIEGESLKLTYANQEYTPDADNKISFSLLGDDTNAVALMLIENTSNEDKTYPVSVKSFPGSYGNPYVLTTLGESVNTDLITSDQIVYYSFVAEKDGTFSITLMSEKCSVSMTNATNSQNANTTGDAENKTVELEVKAGDKIMIDFSTNVKAGVVVTFVPAFTENAE